MTDEDELKQFDIQGNEGIGCAVFVTMFGHYYVYFPEYNGATHELTRLYPFLSWLDNHNYELVSKPEDMDLDDWDYFWIVCSADCAFPPKYIVNAEHDGDALEYFCDGTPITVVEKPDIDDYTDAELHIDNNGRKHDTSSIHMMRAEVSAIYSIDLISHYREKASA
jgi:hypothetical protein